MVCLPSNAKKAGRSGSGAHCELRPTSVRLVQAPVRSARCPTTAHAQASAIPRVPGFCNP